MCLCENQDGFEIQDVLYLTQLDKFRKFQISLTFTVNNVCTIQGRQSLPKSGGGGRSRPSDVEAFPLKVVFFLKSNVYEMPFPAF